MNKYPSLWQWLRKTSASELIVVFMEDLAALLGLIIALIALTCAWITHDARFDAFGSIVVGVVLVSVAWLMGVEIKSMIIGEAPDTDYRKALEQEIERNIPGGKLLRLIALQTGSHEVMIACKIKPGPNANINQFIDQTNIVERELKRLHPEVKWSFVEADHEA